MIGIPHETWGEAVHAEVVPKPGVTATADELIAHCRSLIAGYKVPRAVTYVEQVKRSPSGKADYRWAKAKATGQA